MSESLIAAMLAAAVTATLLTAASAAGTPPCKIGDVPVPSLATKTLRPAEFRALHSAVAPRGAGERWAEIPWEPDLVSARRKASRAGKPLVLWIMDGHPLGCT